MSRETTQRSLSARLRKLILPIAVAAITAGATHAFGGLTLTEIPLATGSYTDNDARGISPDGLWVVGIAGTASTVSAPATPLYSGTFNYTANVAAGYIYDVVGQTLYCPVQFTNNPTPCGGMFGAGYRTYNGQQQLVLGGGAVGYQADWMSASGGPTWGALRRDAGVGKSPTPCQANALGGTSTDVFYATWYDPNDQTNAYKIWVGKYSGAWPTGGSDMTRSLDCWWPGKVSAGSAYPYGVSGTGRAVATVKFGSGDYRNYMFDWTGTGSLTATGFNGLYGGPRGYAYSVSADGNTVFGSSPTPADGQHYHGYKAVFSGPNPTNGTVLASINQLPDTLTRRLLLMLSPRLTAALWTGNTLWGRIAAASSRRRSGIRTMATRRIGR